MDTAKQILVVEDNAVSREALKSLLQAEGYRVSCAADGQEALDYLRRAEPPAVILLDLNMSVMDGWRFCQERRRDAALAGIPVLLLSSEHDLPRIAASLQAAGCFPKPVEFEDLLACVRFLTEDRSDAPLVG